MDRTRWQIDVKSMLIGFLLAVVAGLLLGGRPGRAFEGGAAVAADDQGVYIIRGERVRYVEKQKCLPKEGCYFFSE